MHNYFNKKNIRKVQTRMKVYSAHKQQQNQQKISQQITIMDISLRQNLVRNKSRTNMHDSFELTSPLKQSKTKEETLRTSRAELSSDRQIQTQRCFISAQQSIKRSPYSNQKRQVRINSLVHSEKSVSPIKQILQKSKTKINITLSKNNPYCHSFDLIPNSHETSLMLSKTPSKSQIQEQPIKVNLEKQNTLPKKPSFIQKIKQPEFHQGHPLHQYSKYQNGSYLSKIIIQKVMLPKTKHFPKHSNSQQ